MRKIPGHVGEFRDDIADAIEGRTTEGPKHTPTPWIPARGSREAEFEIVAPRGDPEDGGPVCVAMFYNEGDRDRSLRAVNAHEALVEALEGLVASYRMPENAPPHIYEEHARRYNRARAALRLARGD